MRCVWLSYYSIATNVIVGKAIFHEIRRDSTVLIFPGRKSVYEKRRSTNSIDCGRTALSMMYCVRCTARRVTSRIGKKIFRKLHNINRDFYFTFAICLRNCLWTRRVLRRKFIVLYFIAVRIFFYKTYRETMGIRFAEIRFVLFVSRFNFHYVHKSGL